MYCTSTSNGISQEPTEPGARRQECCVYSYVIVCARVLVSVTSNVHLSKYKYSYVLNKMYKYLDVLNGTPYQPLRLRIKEVETLMSCGHADM